MLQFPDTFLSLVIPCYNEEYSLKTCIEKCLELKGHFRKLELVIVDDCSSDNSLSIARDLINKGKGTALRSGFGIQPHAITSLL